MIRNQMAKTNQKNVLTCISQEVEEVVFDVWSQQIRCNINLFCDYIFRINLRHE